MLVVALSLLCPSPSHHWERRMTRILPLHWWKSEGFRPFSALGVGVPSSALKFWLSCGCLLGNVKSKLHSFQALWWRQRIPFSFISFSWAVLLSWWCTFVSLLLMVLVLSHLRKDEAPTNDDSISLTYFWATYTNDTYNGFLFCPFLIVCIVFLCT